jgi:hypothetical protein
MGNRSAAAFPRTLSFALSPTSPMKSTIAPSTNGSILSLKYRLSLRACVTCRRSVMVDTLGAATNADDIRKHAVELAALAPGTTTCGAVCYRQPVGRRG